MNDTVLKLVMKEVRFTLRPLVLLIMLGISFFLQFLKLPMGVWGALMIPMLWCWLFSLSGTVKGYGAKTIGMFTAPITRTEYVASKYIFSSAATLIVVCMAFIADMIMIVLRENLLEITAFNQYDLKGMLIVYPIVILLVSTVQAFMIYQGTCGRMNYGVTVSIPFVFILVFMNMIGHSLDNTPMYGFWNSEMPNKPLLCAFIILAALLVSYGILYFSYSKCKKNFQKIDL